VLIRVIRSVNFLNANTLVLRHVSY